MKSVKDVRGAGPSTEVVETPKDGAHKGKRIKWASEKSLLRSHETEEKKMPTHLVEKSLLKKGAQVLETKKGVLVHDSDILDSLSTSE